MKNNTTRHHIVILTIFAVIILSLLFYGHNLQRNYNEIKGVTIRYIDYYANSIASMLEKGIYGEDFQEALIKFEAYTAIFEQSKSEIEAYPYQIATLLRNIEEKMSFDRLSTENRKYISTFLSIKLTNAPSKEEFELFYKNVHQIMLDLLSEGG